MTKLHLGCADQIKAGWVNVDSVATFSPDLVHDLTQKLPYEDQSVEEILAKDLLEHFDKYMRYAVFYDWVRVLKIGGRITLEVPNFKKILRRYFKFGFDNFVDYIFGENMIRSRVYCGHFGNHKFAYSPRSLADFVAQFGIEAGRVTTKGLNIQFQGIKRRHVAEEEIDKTPIHSHANSFGDTPDLTLEFVKEKIREFEQQANGDKIKRS